ncbi:unnamed protein product [Cuscuta campestris]|uniref:Uncharacterized protein n=1 Tax=Cuscuta campestris TaxID=132261 RepID=A0A484L5B8_9ASTE|nr:unnamed protein product [Cuscuta campestris]
MSRMASKSRKPPLPYRSPIRLRSRPALRPTTNTVLTPPSVSVTKSERQWGIRPEYEAISGELRALAMMVDQEIGKGGDFGKENRGDPTNPRSPLFERGKLYEEYSARRNERLRKKKGGPPGTEAEEEKMKKASFGLGVRVESSAMKRVQSGRKPVPATPVSRRRETPAPEQTPRYLLRSMTAKDKNKSSLGSGFIMSAGEKNQNKKKKSGVGMSSWRNV